MTKIMRMGWGPDTCDCYTFFFHDADLPEKDRTYWSEEVAPYMVDGELHKGTTRCEIHKEHDDPHKHFLTVLEENQRKNLVHGHINNTEIPIEWEWDSDRTLHITKYETNITIKTKDLQKIVDKELTKNAHGKVVIH
jgi:hypothetical protein